MRYFLLLLFSFFTLNAYGFTAEEPLADAALEQRAQTLFTQIRCVVCEGQPISESFVPLAGEMRQVVRQKLQAGESNAEIIEYFTSRYGDAISFAPTLNASTALLWFSPLILLLAGFAGTFYLKKRRR